MVNKKMWSGDNRKKLNSGYALLTAILAISIFTVLLLKARTMWETELQRDLEQELIFRARQYKTAIEMFRTKNPNLFPQSLDELLEKKFLRKRFTDPMTLEGTWNVVMRSGAAGKAQELLVVPEDMLPQYVSKATMIGVCSSSCEEGFMVYRKKKKYCEWAIYMGEKLEKEMPELKFVLDGEGDRGDRGDRGDSGDERDERGDRGDGGKRGDSGDRTDRSGREKERE